MSIVVCSDRRPAFRSCRQSCYLKVFIVVCFDRLLLSGLVGRVVIQRSKVSIVVCSDRRPTFGRVVFRTMCTIVSMIIKLCICMARSL